MNKPFPARKRGQVRVLPPLEVLDHLFYLDPVTDELRWRISHRGRAPGSLAGHTNHRGYCLVSINGVKYWAHRISFKLRYREEPPECIDHENGDPTDNHADNLRAATHRDNVANSKLRKDNTSGAKGVHWKKAIQKWVVNYSHYGKTIHVGLFDDFEAACSAAMFAREEAYGKFANHG